MYSLAVLCMKGYYVHHAIVLTKVLVPSPAKNDDEMFDIEVGSSIAAYVAATEEAVNINSLEQVLLAIMCAISQLQDCVLHINIYISSVVN